MNDNCKHCGGSKGIHRWNDLACPFDGKENKDGWWMDSTFEYGVTYEQLQAQRDELVEALQKTSEALIALFSETPYGKSPFASGFVEQIANANDALLAKIGKE